MKRSSYLLLLAAWSLLGYSCKCEEESLSCDVLSQTSRDWLSFRENDVLIYRNAAGGQYKFTMKTVNASQPYISYASTAGWFGGCNLEPCRAYADIEGSDTTVNSMMLRYSLEQGGAKNDLQRVNYTIGDFAYQITLPYTDLEVNDPYITVTTVPQITLGSHTYEQVQVATQKPSPAVAQPRIVKVYIAEHFGVVGFEDKEATLYYLN